MSFKHNDKNTKRAPNSYDALAAENARLRAALEILIANARLIPDPDMAGVTDCYAVPMDDIEAAQAILYTDQQETADVPR